VYELHLYHIRFNIKKARLHFQKFPEKISTDNFPETLETPENPRKILGSTTCFSDAYVLLQRGNMCFAC
jgi:hypothetical protein